MAEPAEPHGPSTPLLFLGEAVPPLFCLNIASLSSTISIGCSDKVNRLMKKKLQNFGSILSILFLTYYLQLAVNSAGFRNCLAQYTVHSLSPCYGLLTALVLLNSVARWCITTQFFTKMVSFCMVVCMVVGKNFSKRATSGFFQKLFCGKPKVVKFVFYHSKIRKHDFLLKVSNYCPSSDTHMLVCRKSSCHTIKKTPF